MINKILNTSYLKIILIVYIFSLFSCKTNFNISYENPIEDFNIQKLSDAPNYSQLKFWAEHPYKIIKHATLPKNYTDSLYKDSSNIDVFFIHPTFYHSGKNWNADLNDKELNEKICKNSIKYQASVFSGIANIYAPHYRQMHIHSYTDLKNGYKAFDIAYSDIKDAFLYYWKNLNKSKYFIIAGHSQGTNHAERLLKECILKNDSIKKKLIMSYLPGMPIKVFDQRLPACTSPDQIRCFVSWRTLAEGYFPEGWSKSDSIICTNPISWLTDSTESIKKNHLGILFKNNKIKYPNSVISYNKQGVLWVKPIKIPFAYLYKMDNYHIADYNLFWLNIRSNLRKRLQKNGI